MDELETLEQKLQTLVANYTRLRDDNRDLRNRVLALESENKRLADRSHEARSRIEAVIARLPEAALEPAEKV
jgi:cell division protein ZapB